MVWAAGAAFNRALFVRAQRTRLDDAQRDPRRPAPREPRASRPRTDIPPIARRVAMQMRFKMRWGLLFAVRATRAARRTLQNGIA